VGEEAGLKTKGLTSDQLLVEDTGETPDWSKHEKNGRVLKFGVKSHE